jgi:DNA-binding NtrC family response regulator
MKMKLDEEIKEPVEGSQPGGVALAGRNGSAARSTPDLATSLRVLRAEAEVHAISRALDAVGWNRRRAAELLRISYRGLLYKIRQYNITATTGAQVAAIPHGEEVE